MSTIKANTIEAADSNTDLVVQGAGSGVPNIETGFKVGGTAGVPIADIRSSSGTASSSTFLRGDGTWQEPGGGATTLLSSVNPSAASSVEWTVGANASMFDGTYNTLDLHYSMTHSLNGYRMDLSYATGSPADYGVTGEKHWHAITRMNQDATGFSGGSGGDAFPVNSDVTGADEETWGSAHGMVRMWDLGDTAAYKQMQTFSTFNKDNPHSKTDIGGGMFQSASAITAFKIHPTGGTFTGIVRIYGWNLS